MKLQEFNGAALVEITALQVRLCGCPCDEAGHGGICSGCILAGCSYLVALVGNDEGSSGRVPICSVCFEALHLGGHLAKVANYKQIDAHGGSVPTGGRLAMTNEANRYWSAISSGDMETAHAIAAKVVTNLRSQADEAERQGKLLLPTWLRSEATQIEEGKLAPYPKLGPVLTGPDIRRLTPDQRVTDQRGDEWEVLGWPHYDSQLGEKPHAWSVAVRRVRDGVFTRIDCRNEWGIADHEDDGASTV